MTDEDWRQQVAERRAILAELDAIDAAIDAIQARLGFHQLIADARIEAHEVRARLLLQAPATTVH